jgi:hypothetical protein
MKEFKLETIIKIVLSIEYGHQPLGN